MMITMEGKYRTRDGRAVRILATDLKGGGCLTVVGLITETHGSETLETWTADGKVVDIPQECCRDLIPILTKHEGWMVLHIGKPENLPYGPVYATKDCAIRARDNINTIDSVGGFPDCSMEIVHVTWGGAFSNG